MLNINRELTGNAFVESQFDLAFVMLSEDLIFESAKDSPCFSYALIFLCCCSFSDFYSILNHYMLQFVC